MPIVDITAMSLPATAPIEEAIACIDRSGKISLALVVDDAGRLTNTITDGDVRRAILAGHRLTDPIEKLLQVKELMPNPRPVTAPVGTPPGEALAIMQEKSVRQLPLLRSDGRVDDVILLRDLAPQTLRQLQAVLMAGGEGVRLRPLTDQVPKPMLPVGGKPLMELIVDKLRRVGVNKINIATHYKSEKIIDHFGNGSAFGVDINYVQEESPLGTGGALSLMPTPEEPTLVMNGDILTDIDVEAFWTYHQEHNADMTVAVRRYEFQVPYGVIECENSRIQAVKEKPNVSLFVNAGIYLLEPSVHSYIPKQQHFNMTDLIEVLLSHGKNVVGFPIREYWLDIGQHADYARAQEYTDGRQVCPGAEE
jgi:dTDP-glucose pyrophosphorylase/CBS domain-containing protein